MLLDLIVAFLAFLIIWTLIFQILIPFFRGTPMFPFFRPENELNKKLSEARQSRVEHELEKEIDEAEVKYCEYRDWETWN